MSLCRRPCCSGDAGVYGLCALHVSQLTLLDKVKMRDSIIQRVSKLAATGTDFDMVMDARLLVDAEREGQ